MEHREIFLTMVAALVAGFFVSGCSAPKGSNVAEKRSHIQQMHNETLNKLYKDKPYVQQQIQQAAGYGVFSNINTNLLLVSAGNGFGMVKDNKTGDKFYMKMGQVGVGPGLGLKDFRAIIIFKDWDTMNHFVEKGWEFGGHADAAAKSGEKGGALAAEGYADQDITIYTITEAGAALQATVAGTKYWKDDELN